MECGTSAASRPKHAASVPRSLLCCAPDKCQSVHPSPDYVIRSSLNPPCHFLWHIQFCLHVRQSLRPITLPLEDVVTEMGDQLAKPPSMGRSDHLEIALIVENV